MFRVFIAALLAAAVFSGNPAQAAPTDNEVIKIGVLAKRGPELCMAKWSLTGEYLSHKIPGKKFVILPLDFDQVFSAVEKEEVDFILANPSIYVDLESRFRVNRIATLKNKVKDDISTEFGSVIFFKTQREDIRQLKDLKGKTVMAVSEKSFAGFIMAWRELKEKGIDPFKDFKSLGFAKTHDAVVYSVRDGKADAGIVRTDTLESMIHEGRIKLEDFKVLHDHGGDKVHLPFAHSTRSYPEWPMAKVEHTSDILAEKVTIALLEMSADSPAALASETAGWTIPLNYQSVHEALKFLKIGPYKDFGKITASDVFKKYWVLIFINIAIVIILAWFLATRIKLNQKLNTAREKLLFEINEHKLSQEHVQRLNLVLRTIRSVHNLIVTEKDTHDLVQSICSTLVKNKGFQSAWIAVQDDKKKFTLFEAGLEHEFSLLQDRVKSQGLSLCGQNVLDQPGIQVIDNPQTTCNECPLAFRYKNGSAMRVRLAHGGKVFGLLTVSVSKQLAQDKEEQALFEELAADIGLGLSGLAVERERRKAVQAFRESEKINKKIEAQLRQAQKMESVGRLAGGVAHDYNNALSVIMGYAELAMTDLDPALPLHSDLKQILKAGRHATDITRQLLAFARKQTIAPRVLDLNETVKSMLKMLRRLIGENIDLVWMPGDSLWPVKMDPSQIDQILANLCVNARDAIKGVGKITIETDIKVLDKDYCADHTGFVPGEFVLMGISDNGCGMDKKIQDNIFEPFFTTKSVDKGTGLGLSTVYGIVKQNKGFINVYSEPGKGTTIKIYLRRHEGTIGKILQESTEKIPQGHGETILVVEDDLSILTLTQKILEGLNYKVLLADTPKKAMTLSEKHSNEIHLLITDVIMPEMNGHELSKRLQSLYPDLKSMFMSGYTANAIAHHGVLDIGVAFIQKPFSKKELATFVRKVLDHGL